MLTVHTLVLENRNFVHYRVHNSPQLFPIRSQINPLHTLPTDFRGLHSKLIPYLRLGLPSDLFLSGFCIKTLYASLLTIRATCPAHLDFPYLVTRILFP